MKKDLTITSKKLAFLLRHSEDFKGNLTEQGWAPISSVVAEGIDHVDIIEICRTDSKRRYTISDDGTLIKANQGHSLSNVKPVLVPAKAPAILYHGTTEHAYRQFISNEGLKPMSRHHVHLSDDLKTAKSVASRRRSKTIVLEILAAQMERDGFLFFLSENGVWLTDSVPPKYVKVQ